MNKSDLPVPYKTSFPKIRLGNVNDGGYIFPLGIQLSALMSYGVGSNISFEMDFKTIFDAPVYCFDHTVDRLPVEADILFFKEGISPIKTADCDTIASHMKKLQLENKSIALKIDVEGAEWKSLDSLPEEVVVIVIELHDVFGPNMNTSLLSMLKEKFVCIHVHGNNYCGLSYGIPNTIEATFIRKAMVVDCSVDRDSYPTSLDSPNNPNQPDLLCNWW